MMTITICGSMRFYDDMVQIASRLAVCGARVLLPIKNGFINHSKTDLEYLHYAKIALSDAIIVVNKCGYIGESTKKEIEYALNNDVIVLYIYGSEV